MMTTKHNILSGYSGRYRKIVNVIESAKAQSTDNSRILTQANEKLPMINNDKRKFATVSPPRDLIKKCSLTKPIEEKSKDYENAIKEHLGITNLSRYSSGSNFSPILKPKRMPRQARKTRSIDTNNQEDLAAIELQENKIANSINTSDKQRIIRLKNQSAMRNTDDEDKKIKVLQDSLNKINLMLNKILKKNPIRNK